MRKNIIFPGLIFLLSICSPLFAGESYDGLILSTKGLVGYWKLAEQDSAFVNSRKNHYTGTDEGRRILEKALRDAKKQGRTSGIKIYKDTICAEPYNRADNFYGEHYIRIWRHGDDFDMRTGNFSIEVWIKVALYPTDSVPVIGKFSPFGQSYGLYLTGNTGIRMVIRENNSNSNSAATPSETIKTGQWYHIVGVRDNDTLRIYVNGVMKNESAKGFDIDTGGYGNLHFGGSRWGKKFTGKMRNIALYKRALSSDEIKGHFKTGGKDIQIRSNR